MIGSLHLPRPQRKPSLTDMSSCNSSSTSNSDATQVTSNTIHSSPLAATSSPRRSKSLASNITSRSLESARWSSGDARKAVKRGSVRISVASRRNSDSTSSTTTSSASLNEAHEDDNEKDIDDIQRYEQGQEEAGQNADCEVFDLKSKPGIINVLEEDDDSFALDDVHRDGDGHSENSPSVAHRSTTGRSTTTSFSSGSSLLLTEERVRAHMKDYYEDFDSIFRHGKSSKAIWESFFKQYYREDILWVRSSSNTLKGPELADHFANDIVGIRMQLVSIDSIQILGGTSAVVVYTADQELLYRGHPVSDRAVLTCVLHSNANGGSGQEKILIAHEHRCVGKPIPKSTRWGSGLEEK